MGTGGLKTRHQGVRGPRGPGHCVLPQGKGWGSLVTEGRGLPSDITHSSSTLWLVTLGRSFAFSDYPFLHRQA